MKILVVSNMYPSVQKAYAGIYVKNIYEAFKRGKNISAKLLVMERSYTSFVGSIIKYAKFCLRFASYLPRHFEIIHLHFFYPLIFLLVVYKIFNPSSKLVVTYHGTDIHRHGNSKVGKSIFRYCAKYIDKHIAVGPELSRIVKRKLNVDEVDIMPAGIDEDVFYREENIEKIYDFIFVGSFYEEKGVKELIKAIKLLGSQKLRYCFVGSGPLLNELEKLDQEYLINIMQNQSQNQLRVLYNQSKFLILPSKRDSFGLVVSEALFCGTPAIVSPLEGLIGQVKDGKNGFILENMKTQAIKSGMERAIRLNANEFKLFTTEAKKSNKEFSLRNVCDYHYKLYEALLK